MDRATIEQKIRRLEKLAALLDRNKSPNDKEVLTTISIKIAELLNQLNLSPLPG